MIFRYTILYVDDVPATMDFFARAFGLEQSFLHESGQYGEMLTGQTKLAFSATALMRQLGKNPQPAVAGAPCFELAFETADVAGAVDRAIAAGANLVQAAEEQPWGQVTAYVNDPNGYLVEICSPVQLPNPG